MSEEADSLKSQDESAARAEEDCRAAIKKFSAKDKEHRVSLIQAQQAHVDALHNFISRTRDKCKGASWRAGAPLRTWTSRKFP